MKTLASYQKKNLIILIIIFLFILTTPFILNKCNKIQHKKFQQKRTTIESKEVNGKIVITFTGGF